MILHLKTLHKQNLPKWNSTLNIFQYPGWRPRWLPAPWIHKDGPLSATPWLTLMLFGSFHVFSLVLDSMDIFGKIRSPYHGGISIMYFGVAHNMSRNKNRQQFYIVILYVKDTRCLDISYYTYYSQYVMWRCVHSSEQRKLGSMCSKYESVVNGVDAMHNRQLRRLPMMTSSDGKKIRFTGHLCGEFTGHRWIPRTKASDAELWCFLWSAPE